RGAEAATPAVREEAESGVGRETLAPSPRRSPHLALRFSVADRAGGAEARDLVTAEDRDTERVVDERRDTAPGAEQPVVDRVAEARPPRRVGRIQPSTRRG